MADSTCQTTIVPSTETPSIVSREQPQGPREYDVSCCEEVIDNGLQITKDTKICRVAMEVVHSKGIVFPLSAEELHAA